MTGAEGVAAGAAKEALAAMSGVMKSSDQETAALLEQAKGSKALQHAAEQRAQRIAVRETLLNRLYAPVARLLNIRTDYFDGNGFAEDMAAKTGHLGDDELIEPKASVAAQAMQGLGFSLDEPTLKEMYLNLLATASTRVRANQAHPAFAEIIRQLTGEEANALVPVLTPDALPIVRIHRSLAGQEGQSIQFNHYLRMGGLGLDGVAPQAVAAWADNWVRLGLVEIAYDRYLTASGAYDWIESDALYARLTAQAKIEADARSDAPRVLWGYDRGVLTPTAFGLQFRAAVMSFDTPITLVVSSPPGPSSPER